MADADISDESGEIVFKTEDASVVDENVSPLISTAAYSGSNLDAIMKVLQFIQEQSKDRKQAGTTRAKNLTSSRRTVATLHRTRY